MTPDNSPLDWMPEALHISNGDATDVPGTGLARVMRTITERDLALGVRGDAIGYRTPRRCSTM